MRKIQQFYILKFESDRLKETNYKINNVDLKQARLNGEVVSISNSELIRTLYRITEKKFSQIYLNELIDYKKKVLKKRNSRENRAKITSLSDQIDELLFVKEVISIKFLNKKHYIEIIKRGGIEVGGVLYSPFMFSAAMIRRNSGLFIDSRIKENLHSIFDNGRNTDIPVVPAKYNSYFSLYSSSTLNVSFPRILVANDLIINKPYRVDFGEYVGEGEDPRITNREMEIEFNAFDGCGMVSPKMAKAWSDELELDYTGSTFGVRAPFLKGQCVVFDFHKFSRDIAENEIVTDYYGNQVNINDVDAIVSPSMFKLAGSYSSTSEYTNNCERNNLGWGISKVNPKTDKDKCKTSYQFLQVLDLDESSIQSLCEPTVNWISNSIGGDYSSTMLYLLGDIQDFSEGWFDRLDNTYKAILLNNESIKDHHIITHLDRSFSKKKNISKMGNLFLNGNYQSAVPDLFLYCQHVFGLPLEPLLRDDEGYSYYWNQKRVRSVAAIRSPLVYESEVALINFKNNDLLSEWFSHVKSGIVLPANGYSLIWALCGGMDSDYDLLATINSKEIISGRRGGFPVIYNTTKANKVVVNEDTEQELYNANINGLGTKVGFFTNTSSSFYSLLADFDEFSDEYKTILNRLKWGRSLQGLEIDKTKGLIIPPFPEHWTKYRKTKDMTDNAQIEKQTFYNKIVLSYIFSCNVYISK